VKGARIFAGAAALLSSALLAQSYRAPEHGPVPALLTRASEAEIQAAADGGTQWEHDRPPRFALEEHRRLERALATLVPGRKGVVDAFVVAVAPDSDPVFGREAREAARVLSHRYGTAAGRTIVLAGSDGSADSSLPRGSPDNLTAALARVAELAQRGEDVLVLYTTSHGAPFGIVYNDADQGYGAISPARLWRVLNGLGLDNRLVIVSACYSGVFVPMLSSDTSIVLTAASSERSSFGCQADNDWTFFGDALVNHALRKPQPLSAAMAEATGTIATWERERGLMASDPQASFGAGAKRWLAALEARAPKAPTSPVGRPATATMPPR
jgi:hypothetical protein